MSALPEKRQPYGNCLLQWLVQFENLHVFLKNKIKREPIFLERKFEPRKRPLSNIMRLTWIQSKFTMNGTCGLWNSKESCFYFLLGYI